MDFNLNHQHYNAQSNDAAHNISKNDSFIHIHKSIGQATKIDYFKKKKCLIYEIYDWNLWWVLNMQFT